MGYICDINSVMDYTGAISRLYPPDTYMIYIPDRGL